MPRFAPVRRLGRRGGNPDGDRRAFMHLALDPQHATVQLHDVLDDRQAQAGAAELARAGPIDAIESLGQARDIGGRTPLACTRDDQRSAWFWFCAVAPRGFGSLDRDAALAR